MTSPGASTNMEAQMEVKAALVERLKREVKQIMEEAAVKRHIYEDGASVSSLCVAVEACLSHGLKRRLFGLFGSPSTFALLHKIATSYPPAANIVQMVIQIEQTHFKTQKTEKSLSFDKRSIAGSFSGSAHSPPSSNNSLPATFKHLWIRLSLFEKVLASIVEYISKTGSRFYEPEALMRDPVSATMVSTLLAGPCALEYSKMKTVDNYWTDPPAEELLQRHRIHSRGGGSLYGGLITSSPKSPRPTLQVKRKESLGPDDMAQKLSASAREYVLSLHQNTKTNLLYGKNGVSVWPADAARPLRGYLSLHQSFNGRLAIKWTPNELMHSGSDPVQPCQLWRYAMNLDVRDVVYLHYHQSETGSSIVFVGADGVQHPPIQFPSGQHPLAFLSCLENGMGDWGRLDPPLWSQKGTGKVFPKLKRRSSTSNGRFNESVNFDHPEMYGDYVFRLVFASRSATVDIGQTPRQGKGFFSFSFKERFLSLSSSPATTPPTTPKSRNSLQQSPAEQSPVRKDASQDKENVEHAATPPLSRPVEFKSQMSAPSCLEDDDAAMHSRNQLQTACKSMRYQILSRAFYGWLAHCRHLKTIRTHLSELVKETIISPDHSSLAMEGVTVSAWERLKGDKTVPSETEFYRRVYFGNMPHELRRETWPILLGLYSWGEEAIGREKIYDVLRNKYEELFAEWTAVEAIVRERDKEAFRAARRSGGTNKVESCDSVRSRDASNDLYFESEDETANGSAEGALVMEPLEGLTDVTVTKPVASTDQSFGSSKCSGNTDSIVDSSGHSTPEEGDGGLVPMHVIETFALNLHRIEKDVHRCDRHHPYFHAKNLEKLKNIMCTYVWENLHTGYIQGMCDLAAVLLVVFDDEVLTYGCFTYQMKRMAANFPHGGGMDTQLANLRALLQVFDPELFDLMQKNGDYTHFYFAYRWFLLDFKRELLYDDVFKIWEIIWAAKMVASPNFVVFLSMAMIEIYRDILLDNNMDFTDVIKFFNEMAEKHDAERLVDLARNLVIRLQKAVER